MTAQQRIRHQVVGLIGFPLRHSISPVFQQAAFDFHQLPVTYEAWETPPDRVAAAVERMRQPDCLGANVTIPHKQAVIPYLDGVDELAAKIGAVNTIVNEDGKLHGFNTDVDGFLRGLRDEGSYEPAEKRAVVLGAGGAARAVVFGLVMAEAANVTITNRTFARAEELATAARTALAGADSQVSVDALPWETSALRERLGTCDLLINTTSIGMGRDHADESPLPDELVPADAFVYDLIYNPSETKLLRIARAKGARTLNGLPMLIHQGAAAFEIWTGRAAPRGLMFRRGKEALR